MNTKSLIRRACVALFLLLAPLVVSAQNRDIWLLNHTGSTVTRLYVSPHNLQTWGEDILGRAELISGLGVQLTFNPSNTCFYDFRLVYSNGSTQIYNNGWNLCKFHAIEFHVTESEAY